jgi:hypothetical protein
MAEGEFRLPSNYVAAATTAYKVMREYADAMTESMRRYNEAWEKARAGMPRNGEVSR